MDHKERQRRNQQLSEALARGELGDLVTETFKLVTKGPEAQAFQQHMEGMAKQILGDAAYRAMGGIRFYMSDCDYINAGKIRYAQPPVIIFTRKMIESLTEESLRARAENLRTRGAKTRWGGSGPRQEVPPEFEKNGKGMLMGILAHEIEHIRRGDDNSKGIEFACDSFAVKKLLELGYREQSLSEALKWLVSEKEDMPREIFYNIAEYLDVHPKTDNRIALMDNKFYEEIYLNTNFQKDEQNRRIMPKPVALDASLAASVAAATYESPLDRMKHQRGYEAADKAGKIRILNDIAKTEAPRWDEFDHPVRVQDMVKSLERLQASNYHYQHTDEGKAQAQEGLEVKKAMDEYADTLLGVGRPKPARQWYSQSLFRSLSQAWHGRPWDYTPEDKPLGAYERLGEKLREFTQATNAADATRIATDCENMIARHHLNPNDNAAGVSLELPRFSVPSEWELMNKEEEIFKATGMMQEHQPLPNDVAERMGIKPTWHEHVNWGRQETGASKPIQAVLRRLGISEAIDPRMPVMTPAIPPLREDSLGMKVLTASNGYIVGVKPAGYVSREQQSASRTERIEKRQARLAQLQMGSISPETADWSLIRSHSEEDFVKFTEKYKLLLIPDIQSGSPATPFQKQFVTEVEAQVHRTDGRYNYQYKPLFNVHASQFMARMAESVQAQCEKHKAMHPERGGPSLAMDHPYVDFVARNRAGFVDRDNRAFLVEQTIPHSYRHEHFPDETNPKKYEHLLKNLPYYRQKMGLREPSDLSGLFATYDALGAKDKELSLYRASLLKDMAQVETVAFMQKNPNVRYTPAQLCTICELGKDFYGSHFPAFEQALDAVIQRQGEQDMKLSAAQLVEAYNQYKQVGLFRYHGSLRERYEQTIMEKIEAIPDERTKLNVLENLLLNSPQDKKIERVFDTSARGAAKLVSGSEEKPDKFINNPTMREWAINNWVKLIAEKNAQVVASNKGMTYRPGHIHDDNSDQFYRVAKITADRVVENSSGITRTTMMSRFLDHTEAQKKISYYVRDKLDGASAEVLAKMQYQASAGEAFLDHLAYDPVLRQDTIEFLRSPLERGNAEAFAKKVHESAERARQAWGTGFETLKEQVDKSFKRAELYDKDLRVSTYAAEMLHKNFTHASTQERTFLMEKVLFPPNTNANPMNVTPEKYVFDKVLPETDEYAKYGRSLFKHYLGGLKKEEDYVRRIYLSAMLVAEDPTSREADSKKRVGKAIHTLLASMDNPLAGKLSQAIDSSPVPDWLRNPESKISTNIPPRWKIWEMFEENAPKAVQESTERLGKTKAGAIGVAVELHKDTAKMAALGYASEEIAPKTMYKMVRSGAAEKVELHAPLAANMIEKAAQDFPELRKAKPILQHAIQAARVETDFSNAPVQTEIARRSIDGIKVTINGETYTFHEVPLIKANDRSHEMRFAKGRVFNDLAEAEKKMPAMALVTLENYLHMLGQHVDWDRHGAQAMVDGKDIYLLDRGGMTIDAPTEADKQKLGDAVGKALLAQRRDGKKFGDAIAEIIDKTADPNTGELNHYLSTIARAQHNLGDMRRVLTDDEQKRSIVAVISSGSVDPAIMKGLKKGLTMKQNIGLRLQSWGLVSRDDSVVIDDPNKQRRMAPLDVAAIKSQATAEEPIIDLVPAWQDRTPAKPKTDPRRRPASDDTAWVVRTDGVRTGFQKTPP